MIFYSETKQNAVTIIPVIKRHLEQFLNTLSPQKKRWLVSSGFAAQSGELCLLPGQDYQLDEVFLGLEDEDDTQALAVAVSRLPAGLYDYKGNLNESLILGWALEQYQFSRYKESTPQEVKQLFLPPELLAYYQAQVEAIFLIRDLINTPACDMGPENLAEVSKNLAKEHRANYKHYAGKTLVKDFPAIYQVGKGAESPPCLIELNWGEQDWPLVSIVGKGICFDTGGLDLKPSAYMRLMKKDMGGAAHALGLAKLIMSTQLPIRIQVLIPAAENAISDKAYRPGDIINTRSGKTVEVDNTDAEGRLVLADALTYASEQSPELILDFATLTGAARVAVGTDIAALFSNQDDMAQALLSSAKITRDWVWPLPLHQPYLKLIQPKIADLVNSASTPYAGAITAALFLEQFIGERPWCHFDIMAWNNTSTPGKPEGGEALGLRCVYHYLVQRYRQPT